MFCDLSGLYIIRDQQTAFLGCVVLLLSFGALGGCCIALALPPFLLLMQGGRLSCGACGCGRVSSWSRGCGASGGCPGVGAVVLSSGVLRSFVVVLLVLGCVLCACLGMVLQAGAVSIGSGAVLVVVVLHIYHIRVATVCGCVLRVLDRG